MYDICTYFYMDIYDVCIVCAYLLYTHNICVIHTNAHMHIHVCMYICFGCHGFMFPLPTCMLVSLISLSGSPSDVA